MTRELVDRPELAIENILRYQTELRDDARLAGLMKSAHTWFAARSDDGAWLFAPSKFVGYAGNTANDYLAGRGERGGRDMERVLRRWFALVPPETALTAELGASLARFVGGLRSLRPAQGRAYLRPEGGPRQRGGRRLVEAPGAHPRRSGDLRRTSAHPRNPGPGVGYSGHAGRGCDPLGNPCRLFLSRRSGPARGPGLGRGGERSPYRPRRLTLRFPIDAQLPPSLGPLAPRKGPSVGPRP